MNTQMRWGRNRGSYFVYTIQSHTTKITTHIHNHCSNSNVGSGNHSQIPGIVYVIQTQALEIKRKIKFGSKRSTTQKEKQDYSLGINIGQT